jgi:hypothetical protein
MRKFTGMFDEEHLAKTIFELETAHNAEMYSELMYLRKWLGLFMDNTDGILKGYADGWDMTGAPCLQTSEVSRCETLHYNKKKERLQTALNLAEKYAPFKEG